MKKLCRLVLMCFMVLLLAAQQSEAATVSVRGLGKDGQVETALQDARFQAVRQVLSRIIPPDANPGSIFQRVLANYEKYAGTAGKPDAKRRVPQGMLVMVSVPVDENALARAVRELAAAQQDRHDDVSVYCLVRVTGAENNDAAVAVMARDFANAFKRLGFSCSAGDELPGFRGLVSSRLGRQEYEQQLLQKLQQEWVQVNVALVGEVSVSTEASDATGCLKRSLVRVRAVDMTSGKTYAVLEEDYLRRGPTARDAEQLLVQKTAIDVAEQLAAETLKYWRSNS